MRARLRQVGSDFTRAALSFWQSAENVTAMVSTRVQRILECRAIRSLLIKQVRRVYEVLLRGRRCSVRSVSDRVIQCTGGSGLADALFAQLPRRIEFDRKTAE